ncbi:MAG: PHB depolymerase family esterase [Ktedonobacteraceae bacterium]
MKNYMQGVMTEVTHLTRAGRLAEATAMIQRTLVGPAPIDEVEPELGHADTPSEAEFRVLEDASCSRKTPREDVTNTRRTGREAATAHSTVARRPLFSNALRIPNSIPKTIEAMPLVVPDVASSSVRTSGQFVEKTYTNTAGTRFYKLYIPSGYTGQAVPLVVMLHGCTQTSTNFAAGTHMNVLAEDETFLVAYPEQGPSANRSKCWNWFQESDQHRNAGEPSLIAGITQQVMKMYHVDMRRVYIAGLSSGGAMAAIMAATYPDLYAAVGVHSGLAYGAAHDLPSAFAAMKQGKLQHPRQLTEVVPLITFHGDCDTTVAPANVDRLLDQWLHGANKGRERTQRPMRDVKVERGQVVNGHAYTRSIYHDTSGQAIIEKWMVHQAGHAWSGGSPGGSYTDPKGPDASAEMMRFFTEHPRRG